MSSYRQKLQQLLCELFQFDSADLDFGFYAVMNKRRDQIAQFIESDLLDAVAEGLEHIAAQSATEAQQTYQEARQALEHDSPGLLQGDEIPAEALDNSYIANSPSVQAYLQAREALNAAVVAEDIEAHVYNDLYAFFARYYQDGDFIPQRRYGRSDKYAIPYNGQEVYLHWANFDQYYVKTGVHFNNYSFGVPSGLGLEQGANIRVRLTKVDIPRDNVKGDKRFFIYAEDQSLTWDEEAQTLVIPMEYRPLTTEESERVGTRNQQDKLLAEARMAILQAIPNPALRSRLEEPDPQKRTDQSRLAYHLNRYAAENTRDFFVHKDLGGFLRREFDYYLKAEVLHLDDINLDDVIHARRAAARLKTLRAIGEKIIAFLDQLEGFQRRLFLKRKFVLQSDYCLTLDRIPADWRAEFYPHILANERQLTEWQTLYGVTVASETDLCLYPHLVLDTAFFDSPFTNRLLRCFNDLDDEIDGLLICGENRQALDLVLPRYRRRVKCFYIDPPYNTGEDEGFIYKDQYQHSTWLSLMKDRLQLAYELLSPGGAIAISIDENEASTLIELLNMMFGRDNRATITTVKRGSVTGHKAINPGVVNISEYVVIYAYDKSLWPPNRVFRQKERDTRYNKIILNFSKAEPEEWEMVSLLDEFSEAQGIEKSRLRRELGEEYDELLSEYVIENAERVVRFARPDKSAVSEEARRAISRSEEHPDELIILERSRHSDFYLLGGERILFYSDRLHEIGGDLVPGEAISDIWTDTLPNDLHNEGGVTLKKGKKPEKLVARILQLLSNRDDIVCDFFVGSGTATAVAQKMDRKWIGVEMSGSFDQLTKRRMMNTLHGEQSGISRATAWNGGGMFQYIRLESYDDTFHNLRFREVDSPQVSFLSKLPDYMLNYALDYETAGSPTLLDIEQFARPFNYQLLVTDEDGVLQPQPVDLVTTFNFFIGLAVQTIRHYEYQDQPYVHIIGTSPDGKRVCVVWRNVLSPEQLDAERDWVMANVLHDVNYDRLYVNGENTIPGALLIEEEFKRRMFEDVH